MTEELHDLEANRCSITSNPKRNCGRSKEIITLQLFGSSEFKNSELSFIIKQDNYIPMDKVKGSALHTFSQKI
jgi:hypothetical protein